MGWSLNIGSGETPMRVINKYPCINIDIRDMSKHEKYKEAIFVRGNVKKLPFPNESFEAVLASDIIEHFPKSETKDLIKEWARVLKSGGLMMFRTPSLKWVVSYYSQTGDAEFVSYHIFGGQNYPENFHYVIFDNVWLAELCKEFGMNVIDYKENHSNFELVLSKI